MELRRNEKITFRCTELEKDALAEQAARCSLSVSEYCRSLSLGGRPRERYTEEERQLLRDIAQLKGTLQRLNNYFGCNFKRLINSYRVVRAKELLDGKDCPVNELFSRCGFASKSVFYVAFRKVVGMTPLQYISQSRNPFMIQRN